MSIRAQRNPKPPTPADAAGHKVDNATDHPFVVHDAGVTDDATMVPASFLSELLRPLLDQHSEVRELLRRPQPVWMRGSDSFHIPAGTLIAGASPRLLVSGNPDRLRVLVRNIGTTGVMHVLSSASSAVPGGGGGGLPLAPGEGISLDTKAPIYAAAVDDDVTWVALAEYVELGTGAA